MRTVAIISEYNPFHNGHLYQIEKIRDDLGEETAIIAIMSGSVTQRGELAVIDKWKRAEAAVSCGVNLVLELPFPYSASSAEFFARAGVSITNSLGIVDTLSFGSESGDIEMLLKVAKKMMTDDFKAELERITSSSDHSSVGYPKACELAYNRCTGKSLDRDFFSANNLLALEYIKACIALDTDITIHTVKRDGGAYIEESIVDSPRQSATTLRRAVLENIYSAKEYMPSLAFDIMANEYKASRAPADIDNLSAAVLNTFCLNPLACDSDVHDAGGGLYNRIKNMSFGATSISSLIESVSTKKYTTARIRRAILNSYFGVTSSDLKELPRYTQVLAMDKLGQSLLKKAKKIDGIELIVKPSAVPEGETAKKQKHLADKAEMAFQLARPIALPQSYAFRVSPFVKK